jgi:hypothetical protein
VKRTLAVGKLNVLGLLQELISQSRMKSLVEDTIYELLGPYTLTSSLNVAFNSAVATRLVRTFQISEEKLRNSILSKPGIQRLIQMSAVLSKRYIRHFPQLDRILNLDPARYGIGYWRLMDRIMKCRLRAWMTVCLTHKALSRATSNSDLHALHDTFLAAGFTLRSRHVRILASRGFKF